MDSLSIIGNGFEPYWPADLLEKLGLGELARPTISTKGQYAEISFQPNLSQHEARRERNSRSGRLQACLPDDWPSSVTGPTIWRNNQIPNTEHIIFNLSSADKREIWEALQLIRDHEYDEINATTFPLPNLKGRLTILRDEVYDGHGFCVLRGLLSDGMTADERLRIYLGISSHIAPQHGMQNQEGTALGHIVDYGKEDSELDLPMHTDVTADVVATWVIRSAQYGGDTTLASIGTIYNEMAATRPDLVRVLATPDWPFDTYGRDPPYFYRAVMFYYNERIIANFSRRLLTGNPFSPRTKSIPGLSEIQAEALDTLHFLAQKHQVKFEVREGDMRFINNFAFLHGRSAYSDEENSTVTGQPADEEMRSRRHLMRLWLHNPRKAWSLPPALKLIWARTFDDADRLRRWDPSSSLEDNDAVTVKPPQKPIPNPKPKPRPQPPPATAPCD